MQCHKYILYFRKLKSKILAGKRVVRLKKHRAQILLGVLH